MKKITSSTQVQFKKLYVSLIIAIIALTLSSPIMSQEKPIVVKKCGTLQIWQLKTSKANARTIYGTTPEAIAQAYGCKPKSIVIDGVKAVLNYDNKGRLIQKTVGKNVNVYKYNKAGFLTNHTGFCTKKPNSKVTTTITYNSKNQQMTHNSTFPEGCYYEGQKPNHTCKEIYGADKKIHTQISDGNTFKSWLNFDPQGRPVSIDTQGGGGGFSEQYTYDAAGRVVKVALSGSWDGLKEFEYNAEGQIIEITQDAKEYLKFEYDDNGNMISIFKTEDGDKMEITLEY